VVRGPAVLHTEVRAAIALTRSVRKQPAALRILQVAGSVRTLRAAVSAWHAAITAAMSASVAAEPAVLGPAFFRSLDADLDDLLLNT
jgi:hypothetical protein